MQAVLILGHKNVDQIIDLCEKLTPYFNVYIHFDAKMPLSQSVRNEFDQLGVKWIQKYDVKWGGFTIGKAAIALMKLALEDSQNNYFHLISGQDWPCEDPQDIYNRFKNTDEIFMDYFPAISTKKSGESLIWWAKLYFNYDNISLNRKSFLGKIYHRILLLTQLSLRINKLHKYGIDPQTIYYGQNWVDIPRDALEFAIHEYDSNIVMQKVYSSSFCADEMWLQTILCNSRYKDRINKNIHRYIAWTKKHNSYPAILDEEDFDNIKNGNYWWARKIEKPVSDQLINQLNNY